jgi:ParB-like chromosome segregation protein Spo0J
MSERVGKKRSTIANYLRLLKLDPIIQTEFVMDLLWVTVEQLSISRI